MKHILCPAPKEPMFRGQDTTLSSPPLTNPGGRAQVFGSHEDVQTAEKLQ